MMVEMWNVQKVQWLKVCANKFTQSLRVKHCNTMCKYVYVVQVKLLLVI